MFKEMFKAQMNCCKSIQGAQNSVQIHSVGFACKGASDPIKTACSGL